MSEEEYLELIDIMNVVKHELKDYGYEDTDGRSAYAREYSRKNRAGRKLFVDIVKEARDKSKGKTPRDIIDYIANYQEGKFNEEEEYE